MYIVGWLMSHTSPNEGAGSSRQLSIRAVAEGSERMICTVLAPSCTALVRLYSAGDEPLLL